ncbi:hypothetical protein DNU06_13120 [Putridiphycobacter roseus]|uniref:Uncharacterized protein n=1 Tax=Putridiphycobacter roseus TaxID=2219161 RepID=A0A2W1NLE9_9FLAO|nr:hypothetical protein [Putridiphycobacter roseus]PZE16482.1 hypothetical protein DNU06_13120 [Putridiphycobacter roseus]
MSSSNPNLAKIEIGVDLLLDKISSLSLLVKNQEERIDLLNADNVKLRSEINGLEAEKVRLKAEIQSKANNSAPSVFDKSAYNQKINDLVKEINSCISLLNK